MDLDRPAEYPSVDRGGMLRFIMSIPEDLLAALDAAEKVEVPEAVSRGSISIRYGEPRSLVICGMGGSAIGGDLLRAWLYERAGIPVEVARGYRLPAFVGPRDLVVAVSYSGNTEETLSCFLEAIKRGAMLAAVTSGGLLGRFAERLGIPLYRVPPGRPPRAALPYLLVPAAVLLEKLGVEIEAAEAIKSAASSVASLRERLKPEVSADRNPAKSLALEISGKIPIIYAYRGYYPAAYRFKCQLNENSKYPAYCAPIPEMNHNEIVGWEREHELTRRLLAIFLEGGDEPEEIRVRLEVTRMLVSEAAAGVRTFKADDDGRLARLMQLVCFGDFVSYYLAILRDVDPTPIPSIDRLKRELGQRATVKRRVVEELERLIPA